MNTDCDNLIRYVIRLIKDIINKITVARSKGKVKTLCKREKCKIMEKVILWISVENKKISCYYEQQIQFRF